MKRQNVFYTADQIPTTAVHALLVIDSESACFFDCASISSLDEDMAAFSSTLKAPGRTRKPSS